ncbi:MAG: solute carrier family 25 protein [Gammaproteobacteria bacterium]|nr:solute carrier family 25 protein [Gammaproteobacteria bacterium]
MSSETGKNQHASRDRGYGVVSPMQIVKYHVFPQAAAGVLDRALFHPWETVNTLKQDSTVGYRQLVRSFWHTHGMRGFYQGYLPNVAAAVPIRVSIFGTYSFVTEQGRYTNYSPVTISLFAGGLSGFCETTILCPADAYRVRKTLPETAKLPFYPRYLFKGYGPLLLRTSIENTVCLLGTDLLMNMLTGENSTSIPLMRFACALIAGAASQYVSTPFDNIKTRRMKMVDSSYKDVVSSLYKEGGFGTFFRSAHAKAGRAGVCNAVMIGTSKLILDHMEKPSAP